MKTIILKKSKINDFICGTHRAERKEKNNDDTWYIFSATGADETDIKPRMVIDYEKPIKEIFSAKLVIGSKMFELTPEQIKKLNNGDEVKMKLTD